MKRTTIRILLRQNRFELFTLAASTLAIVMLLVAAMLAYGRLIDLGCLGSDPPFTCQDEYVVERLLVSFSAGLSQVAMIVPVFLSVILGIRLVGLEVERGTAALPWTLGRSRVAWLFQRAVVLAIIIAAAGLAIGLACDALLRAAFPTIDLGSSLYSYVSRGWLVPAYALVAFGLATLIGAVLGRVLPALIVTLLAGMIIFISSTWGFSAVMNAEAVPLQVDSLAAPGVTEGPTSTEGPSSGGGSTGGSTGPNPAPTITPTKIPTPPDPNITLEYRLRDRATQRYVSWDEVYVTANGAPPDMTRYEQVLMGIPGERSLFIIGREVVLFTGFAVFCVGLSGFVVTRRRPY